MDSDISHDRSKLLGRVALAARMVSAQRDLVNRSTEDYECWVCLSVNLRASMNIRVACSGQLFDFVSRQAPALSMPASRPKFIEFECPVWSC